MLSESEDIVRELERRRKRRERLRRRQEEVGGPGERGGLGPGLRDSGPGLRDGGPGPAARRLPGAAARWLWGREPAAARESGPELGGGG